VKALAFDRQIVAMQAYENLLVVAYHEGIPMWGCQNISMHIFSINSSNVVKISESHVPIQPQSTLRWFGFSQEGMLFSQDSNGFVRAYSLETNEWTSLIVNNFPDSKKMWIVGMKNYQIYYWRTTDTESYPTVRPRLNMKESTISIATMEGGTEQIELYASLLWDRFCLEHELSRWRIWGLHKKSREK
jgi:chromosome transmission fidelity protein 4